MTYDYQRVVNFTTNSASYDLLQDPNISVAIMEKLGLNTEQYNNLLLESGRQLC